jgi:hypothetical protein
LEGGGPNTKEVDEEKYFSLLLLLPVFFFFLHEKKKVSFDGHLFHMYKSTCVCVEIKELVKKEKKGTKGSGSGITSEIP